MTTLSWQTRELIDRVRARACAEQEALATQTTPTLRLYRATRMVDELLDCLAGQSEAAQRDALRYFFRDTGDAAVPALLLRRACGLRAARSLARSTALGPPLLPRQALAQRWREDAHDALTRAAQLERTPVLTPIVVAELEQVRLLLRDVAPFQPEAAQQYATIDAQLAGGLASSVDAEVWSARMVALGDIAAKDPTGRHMWQAARREDELMAALGEAGAQLTDTLYWRLAACWPARVTLLALGAAAADRGALARRMLEAAMQATQPGAAEHDDAKLSLFLLTIRSGDAVDREVAHRLFEDGHAGALRLVAARWGGDGPLPVYLRDYLHRVLEGRGLAAVVATAESLPAPSALRIPLFLACLEHFFLPEAAVPSAVAADDAFTCACCLETHGAEGEHGGRFRLAGCACGPDIAFCREAVLSSLRHAEALRVRDACPGGCGAPFSRQDLERLDVPTAQLDARFLRILRARLAREYDWQPCVTAHCPSGRVLPPDVPAVFDCGLCGTANAPVTPDADPVVRHRLVAGLAAAAARNGERVYRECFHCAVPVEKGEHCLHMTCPRCSGHWDFEVGPFDPERDWGVYAEDGIYAQAYRPLRDGLVAYLGIYEGIPRGPITEDQQGLVLARAAAWLRDNPPADGSAGPQ